METELAIDEEILFANDRVKEFLEAAGRLEEDFSRVSTAEETARARAAGRVIADVMSEFSSACDNFPPFNSAHEGISILKEEVDELWEEVRARQGSRDVEAMYAEACQVAAMAIRFMVDVCSRGQQ